MAEQRFDEIESGMIRLFGLRWLMALLACVMLLGYFSYMDVGVTWNTAMVLVSVLMAFLVMYFTTVSTLIVSKYDHRGLFFASVYTAIVYSVVPIAFGKLGPASLTPLAHVFCSVLAGLPLCLHTLSRFGLVRARFWYAMTLGLATACLIGMMIRGVQA
jgi:hypothetical protein